MQVVLKHVGKIIKSYGINVIFNFPFSLVILDKWLAVVRSHGGESMVVVTLDNIFNIYESSQKH